MEYRALGLGLGLELALTLGVGESAFDFGVRTDALFGTSFCFNFSIELENLFLNGNDHQLEE